MWRRVTASFLLLALCTTVLLPVLLPAAAAPVSRSQPPCYLLDNPKIRAAMSGAYELALLQDCGRFTPGSPLPAGQAVLSGWPESGLDVRVNGPDPEGAPNTTQSETTIAVNAETGTICSAYNDSYHTYEGTGYAGFSRSTDGGQTFTDSGPFPPIGPDWSRGDPSLVWRAADGRFYFASMLTGGYYYLGLWRSDDDCATFRPVGLIDSGQDDKPFMTVDNDPASLYFGRFYVVWTDFTNMDWVIHVSHSDDGVLWSLPLDLSGQEVQGAWPAVGPGGEVYVGWLHWNGWPFGNIDVQVARSTDGGMTFTRVTNPLTNVTSPRDAAASQNCGREALNGNIRYLASPQLAVGSDSCLHVVYSYDPDGYDIGDVIDVFYRRSCTHGATWAPEVRLSDDSTLADQFFPTIAVNEQNIVAASWYDRRLDAGNNYLFDRYQVLSTDGGTTWEPNGRVSDASSPVYHDPGMSSCYHGDYDQIVADAGMVYLQWSDDRLIFDGHNDADVWFDGEVLTCEPIQGADFSWEPTLPAAGEVVTLSGFSWGNGGGWLIEASDFVRYARQQLAPTPPVTYAWTLGDGAMAVGQVITHSYSLPGAYTVVLTATNCGGATATASHLLTVTAPAISVSPVPTVTLYPAQLATGTLVISNTGDSTLTWSLVESPAVDWLEEAPPTGTLAPGTAASVVLTYTAPLFPGLYTTALRVSSNDPFHPQVDVPIALVVQAAPCDSVEILTLTAAISACQVTFGAEVTGTLPYSYSWDFGSFGVSTETNPLLDFDQSGTYPYSLTVSNCGGTDTATGTVTVECAPTCTPVEILTVTTAISACQVTFGAELTGTAPYSYSWNFGPFGTSVEPGPLVDFGSSGEYAYTLTAFNCTGIYSDTVIGTVAVECTPPSWTIYVPLVFKRL